MTDFAGLNLAQPILRALSDEGYTTPTPIQEKSIPPLLEGRDLLGVAQTGTGKTASFALPILQSFAENSRKAVPNRPFVLILAPTRELVTQIAESLRTYGRQMPLRIQTVFGGTSMRNQIVAMQRGVHILVATPGRLMDLMKQRHVNLDSVDVFVLDEADRMLDMGFIPDVEKIVSKLPQMRTTLLFSATMPPEIKRLADRFLINPKEITVSKPATAAETIKQGLVMVTGAGRDQASIAKRKREVLRKLIEREQPKNAIIFCNRKRDVDVVYKSLERHGYNTAARLHGDMVQSVRMETLSKFKSGDVTLLVCSDVAARGLDIPLMSHVFNFDVPTHADDYVHRIGRTGRAGHKGVAISIAVPSDGKYVDAIEKLMGRPIDHDPMSSAAGSGGSGNNNDDASAPEKPEKEERGERGRGRGRDRGRGRKPASTDAKAAEPAADATAETAVNAEPAQDAPKAEAATPAAEEPAVKPSRARKSRSDQRNDAGTMDDKDVVFGQSDQVPAFLKNF